jgi:hypothetical protein
MCGPSMPCTLRTEAKAGDEDAFMRIDAGPLLQGCKKEKQITTTWEVLGSDGRRLDRARGHRGFKHQTVALVGWEPRADEQGARVRG